MSPSSTSAKSSMSTSRLEATSSAASPGISVFEGVRWVDITARAFTLNFSPFEVADRLRELMTSRPCAWIFTSATLAVGADFDHFLGRIGASDARTLRVASPFDFERQAMLYLPQGLPDPSDRGHTVAVLAAALPLIEAADGRTFLLFTSHRALKKAARLLRLSDGFEERYPMLVQGEAPRESLLKRFREEEHSVLLGTSSFWEGVDVRGPALVLVVIDKLPFASPDDPLLKARLEGINRRGGNSEGARTTPSRCERSNSDAPLEQPPTSAAQDYLTGRIPTNAQQPPRCQYRPACVLHRRRSAEQFLVSLRAHRNGRNADRGAPPPS